MKRINNKGFSMVELLAVIVILGILMTIGFAAYTRYRQKARQQAYDTMVQSSIEAAEEYLMDHPKATTVMFNELVDEEYLDTIQDPRNNSKDCAGRVVIKKEKSTNKKVLDTNSYEVNICCKKYNYTYSFPGGNKVENKEGCVADIEIAKFVETDANKCVSGQTKTKTVDLYSMDYLTKACEKDSKGKYGKCADSPKPTGVDVNVPCRTYQYHLRKCECTYSKTSKKFCSSQILERDANDHIMKVRYLDTPEGHEACESSNSKAVNSFVHSVCSGSLADKSEITFHGYIFYSGKSQDLRDFNPDSSWFHSANYYEKRVPKGPYINGEPDYEQGCRDTCIKLTEEWSGKVE